MFNKIIGGILLIIGTSIGGGMLALPMATAAGGFLHSLWLFLGAWLVTVIGAFFILEVNLWLPERTNMISMARATLGIPGQVITWISYLVLLYALLAAYIAGGSDLLHNLLNRVMHIPTPAWLDAIIFVIIFGSIVHRGISLVDWANRGLMSIKVIAYVLLIIFITPHIQLERLTHGEFRLLSSAAMVVITSFGYATIIPSLRTYFNSDVKTLRLTIAIGSLIPLICYILWDLAVQGSISREGIMGLMHMTHSGHSVSDLTQSLSIAVQSNVVYDAAHVFTTICVTTSFLGVALCLSDFLADGMQVEKRGKGAWIVSGAALLPPLAIILVYPGIFIQALAYAGIICVILLMLLPALMAWSGRYLKKTSKGYQVWGGKTVVAFEIIVSVILIIYGCLQVF